MADGDAKLFLLILTFFAFWTGAIGIINMSAEGSFNLKDMAALSGPVPGQSTPAISGVTSLDNGNTVVYNQDFTTGTGYSTNVTRYSGTWSQSNGIGYTCTAIPVLPLFEPAAVYPYNIIPTNGVYDAHYTVSNPNPNDDYYIILSIGGNPEVFLRFEPAGIHVSRLAKMSIINFPMNDVQFYPYLNANMVTDVRVLSNPSAETAEVIINGVSVTTFSNTGVAITGAQLAYAGVATYHTGLVISRMDGQFMTQNEGDVNWITLIINAVKTVISAISGFVNLISAIIGLTSQPLVPFAIWAVAGLPAIATLAYLIFRLWRGGG